MSERSGGSLPAEASRKRAFSEGQGEWTQRRAAGVHRFHRDSAIRLGHLHVRPRGHDALLEGA